MLPHCRFNNRLGGKPPIAHLTLCQRAVLFTWSAQEVVSSLGEPVASTRSSSARKNGIQRYVM
jgi:hypothetical protein